MADIENHDALLLQACALNAVLRPLCIRKRNVILTARDMQGYNLILAELQALHAHDFTAQASEADDAQNTEAVVSDATQAAIEEMKRAA